MPEPHGERRPTEPPPTSVPSPTESQWAIQAFNQLQSQINAGLADLKQDIRRVDRKVDRTDRRADKRLKKIEGDTKYFFGKLTGMAILAAALASVAVWFLRGM